jgi:hypothetical protein
MKKNYIVALFILLFSLNSYAMQFETPDGGSLDIYASIRAYTAFESVKSDTYELAQMRLNLQSNSRVGFIYEKENLYALIELGGMGGEIKNRLAYLGYKFSENTALYMGQLESITTTGEFERRLSDDGAADGFGSLATPRRPGILFSFYDLSVQLSTLRGDYERYSDMLESSVYLSENVRFQEVIPKIEISYTFKPLTVLGAFAQFGVKADQTDLGGVMINEDKNFDTYAYLAALLVNPSFGSTYLSGTAFYSVNGGLFDQVLTGDAEGEFDSQLGSSLKDDSEIYDITSFGAALAVGQKFSDALTLEIGGGYQTSSSDAYTKDDNNFGVYATLIYKPVQHLQTAFEIGYMDFLNNSDGSEGAKVYQAGIQVRLDI